MSAVLRVADADLCGLEQVDDGRQDLFARQPGTHEIPTHVAADLRQRARESHHAIVFAAVPYGTPAAMVTVLFPASRVAPYGLEMPIRVTTDPNVRPGGRNDQPANSLERSPVADDAFARIEIHETLAGAPAADPA